MLAAAMTVTACGSKATQEDAQQTLEDASFLETDTEQNSDEENYSDYSLTQQISENNFSCTMSYGAVGDVILDLKNLSDTDYSYLTVGILYYDAAGNILDYDDWGSFYSLLAGEEQITRFTSNMTEGSYDHVEMIYAGDVMETEDSLDSSVIAIEQQAQTAYNQIVAKCTNNSGEDLYSIYAGVKFYKEGQLVGTTTVEYSLIAAGRTFVMNIDAPTDGNYNVLTTDDYDSYQLEIYRVVPLAQG